MFDAALGAGAFKTEQDSCGVSGIRFESVGSISDWAREPFRLRQEDTNGSFWEQNESLEISGLEMVVMECEWWGICGVVGMRLVDVQTQLNMVLLLNVSERELIWWSLGKSRHVETVYGMERDWVCCAGYGFGDWH